MIHALFFACLLLQQATAAPATSSQVQAAAAPTRVSVPADLAKVKRIYVDSFGDDPISKEMQSMIVSALVASKRFTVTENRNRADAVLKGVALEKTSQELHAYGDSTAVGGAAGSQHGEVNAISGSSNGSFVAHHAGISDSSVNTETIDRARVAIRLVNADGDVIWTTTQESKGAKYKGASADAADMCVKQLVRDVAKLEVGTAPQPAAAPAPTPSSATHP
jgi:curli biogenesis system outer membrane secretion channel CsgG